MKRPPEPSPPAPRHPARPPSDSGTVDGDRLPTDTHHDEGGAFGDDGPPRKQILVRRDAAMRIDLYLQNRLKGISRSKLQKLIDLGGVTINGKRPKRSALIHKGDRIDIILPPQAVRTIEPEPIPIDVLYEDDAFMVINKQAGVLVHPARNHLSGTLLNGLAYRFGQEQEAAGRTWSKRTTRGFTPTSSKGRRSHGAASKAAVAGLSQVGAREFRPGIVHRLDKNTTGVIVIAKSDEAHWGIARQFEDRSMLKAYLAVVHGNLDSVGGVVEEPIGKHPTIREAQAVRHDHLAKHAVTLYRVREQYQGYSLVELEPKTGRTHQIRVHLSFIGHPIVGDLIYGGEAVGTRELTTAPTAAGSRKFVTFARDKAQGQRLEADVARRHDLIIAHPALHAAYLSFVHPITHKRVTFTAPLHEPMSHLLRELGKRRIHAPVATEGYHVELDFHG